MIQTNNYCFNRPSAPGQEQRDPTTQDQVPEDGTGEPLQPTTQDDITPSQPTLVSDIQLTGGVWNGTFYYKHYDTTDTAYVYKLMEFNTDWNSEPHSIKYDWTLRQWLDAGTSDPEFITADINPPTVSDTGQYQYFTFNNPYYVDSGASM